MSYRDLKTIQDEITHSLEIINGLTSDESTLRLGEIIFEIGIHIEKLRRLNRERNDVYNKCVNKSE